MPSRRHLDLPTGSHTGRSVRAASNTPTVARVPGTFFKAGQQWTSQLECLGCGQNYTHIEASPDLADTPDHVVPFACEDCGDQLIRLSVHHRVIRYERGSRLDRLR